MVALMERMRIMQRQAEGVSQRKERFQRIEIYLEHNQGMNVTDAHSTQALLDKVKRNIWEFLFETKNPEIMSGNFKQKECNLHQLNPKFLKNMKAALACIRLTEAGNDDRAVYADAIIKSQDDDKAQADYKASLPGATAASTQPKPVTVSMVPSKPVYVGNSDDKAAAPAAAQPVKKVEKAMTFNRKQVRKKYYFEGLHYA